MNIRALLITSTVAGIVMGLLSNLPIIYLVNCIACIWLWGSGIFAAWFYQRLSAPITTITSGQGAIVGTLSGIIGAIVGTIASVIFGGIGLGTIWAPSGSLEDIANSIGLHLGIASILGIVLFIIYILIYPVFGAIGGVIGSTIFNKS